MYSVAARKRSSRTNWPDPGASFLYMEKNVKNYNELLDKMKKEYINEEKKFIDKVEI